MNEALAINSDGKFVATASETGTLIRVFSLESLDLIYEFRRGSQQANIYDISFNMDSTMLACCSNNGTVHFFQLYKNPNTNRNTKSMLSGLKDYLPQYFSSEWSFKQVFLGYIDKSISSFDSMGNLHIVSYDGTYNRISFKTEDSEPTIYRNNLHASK